MKSNLNINNETEGWQGFSLEELRYRRALNHVRIEVEKERIMSKTSQMYTRSAAMTSSTGNLFKKLSTGFSVLDYALLAFQAGKQIHKIYRFFHKK